MKGAPSRAHPNQLAWANSAAGKRSAQRAAAAAQRARQSKPKCGAKRKGDGAPCQMLALENGRCRLHGGATPSGDRWHRAQWPGPDAPPEKLEKKLRELRRRKRQQAARVAAMTPEQRARYEAWHRTHKPGSAAERERRRRDQEGVELLRRTRPPQTPSPEQAALVAEIEKARADRLAAEALIARLMEQEGLNDE